MRLLDDLPILMALDTAVEDAEARKVHHPILVLLIDGHAREWMCHVAALAVLAHFFHERVVVACCVHVVDEVDLIEGLRLRLVVILHILHLLPVELLGRVLA